MSLLVLFAMVLLVLAAAMVAMILASLMRGPSGSSMGLGDRPRLRRLGLTTRTLQWLGVLVGVVLIAMISGLGGLGRGMMMVPVVFGVTQILAVAIANFLTRRSACTPGVAAVEVRRVLDLVPRALCWVTAGAAVILAVLLTWTTAVASADDQGRAGRSFNYACADGCQASLGPWPGSYYSVPLATAVVLVLFLAALTLRQTALRPRNGADAKIALVDDTVRRGAARSVVAGA